MVQGSTWTAIASASALLQTLICFRASASASTSAVLQLQGQIHVHVLQRCMYMLHVAKAYNVTFSCIATASNNTIIASDSQHTIQHMDITAIHWLSLTNISCLWGDGLVVCCK